MKLLSTRLIDRTVVLEGESFASEFPRYRNFMVTLWGAIYTPRLLRKVKFKWSKNVTSFADTAVCMEIFKNAKRAGVLAENLHKYNVDKNIVSYKYNPNWFCECKYIHKISRMYLIDYGEISKENENYLYILFLILLKYIFPRIQNANVSLSEKVKSLDCIFRDNMTQHVIKHWEEVGIESSKDEFKQGIEKWFYAQDGWTVYRQAVEDIIVLLNS